MCLFVLLREISSFFGKSFSFLFSLFVINILFVLHPPPKKASCRLLRRRYMRRNGKGLDGISEVIDRVCSGHKRCNLTNSLLITAGKHVLKNL